MHRCVWRASGHPLFAWLVAGALQRIASFDTQRDNAAVDVHGITGAATPRLVHDRRVPLVRNTWLCRVIRNTNNNETVIGAKGMAELLTAQCTELCGEQLSLS